MKHLLLAFGTTLVIGVPSMASPEFKSNPTFEHEYFKAKPIKGKVTNAKGEPLAGVTVQVKGLKTSTITQADGTFTIEVPNDAATLVFTFVGMERKEVSLAGKSVFNIQMAEADQTLNDVVVVGYGTQKKASLTGAVASVNVKDIEDLPVTNLSATLQGRIAGVAVSGGTDRPGSNASISIRVPVSLTKDGPQQTNPLYVIDDVIRSIDDFNLLDPSEIESISVLKDAAAAIYGARSSQGVIVVKTKRGKAGKTQLNFNTSQAINDATQLPKMMNGYELANYLNSALIESYRYGSNPQGYLTDAKYYTPDELDYFKTHNYNWLDHAWKSSLFSRYALNVSGGSDRATFFAGASYVKQDGNLPNINVEKWTFRASTDVKLTAGLKAGLSVSGDLSKRNMYLLKQGGTDADKDVKSLLMTPGFTPPYVNGFPVRLSASGNQNTLDAFHFYEVQRLNNYNKSNNTGLNVQANLEYQIPFIKGLSAKVQYAKIVDFTFPKEFGTKYKLYSFKMTGGNNHLYTDSVLGTTTVSNGTRVYFKPSTYEAYQLNAYLTYSRRFGKHDINAIAIVEQSENHYDDVQAIKEDPTEGAPDNARFAFGAMDVYETESEAAQLGYIGRINYSYADKYLAELAFRYDGSTNFPPNNRFGFFPSASFGWVVSEEPFFKNNVSFIDFFKLRGSVGFMGGDNTKAYAYIQRYTPDPTKGPVFGGNNARGVGTRNEAMPNPYIHWDDDTKLNAGFDARFLKNRLSATVEGFYDHRYNLLTALSASVPLTVGSTIGSENFSTINGYGYEVSLGWKDNLSKDVNYYINGFFNWNDAKAIKVDVNKGLIGTYEDPIGKSTDMGFKGLYYIGMFRSQAEVNDFLAKNPNYTIYGETPRPGMLYYRDIRGPKDPSTNQYAGPDGKIDDNDMDFIAPKASNHYGFGLSVGGSYKGLRLDVVMSGAFGGQTSVEGTARSLGTLTSSRPEFWADHYTPENPDAAYPNPYWTSTYNVASSFWLRSAFSFRMRSANLSYSIPTKYTNRIGFSNLKVYVSATNPFNFYNPFDYRDNASTFDTYPTLRTIALGINASL